MKTLTIGSHIKIQRSNGTIQNAVVSCIDYNVESVQVEWLENDESKGKEIPFSLVTKMNSELVIPAYESEINSRKTISVKTLSTKPKTANIKKLIVQGKRVKTTNSTGSARGDGNKLFKESVTVRKVNQLEKERIERRQRHAEVKAEKEKIFKENSHNPHWILSKMILQYQSAINIKPLSGTDKIEEHLITVAVRKRPLNQTDLRRKEIDIVTIPNKNQLIVHEPKYKVDLTRYLENHTFTFDYTFNEHCNNEIVYKFTAQPLIKTVFEGGFATCFAYGQTGAGKTHTMSGDSYKQEKGIYALAASDIFEQLTSNEYDHLNLSVGCSFFEIYAKKMSDLLNRKSGLKMLEDGKQQIQIVGLTERKVKSVNEVLELIKLGNEERASGQTSANLNSSRSHAIFQICLRSKSKLHGKFSLIDLAGNERGADTFSSSKVTRLEGAEINQSLLSLKECIRALSRKGAHLPFRGSKLTQVLRDSFVGSKSKTCMIAMISPGISSCENTLNTLRYADRVKELEYNNNKEIKFEESKTVAEYGDAPQSKFEDYTANYDKVVGKLRTGEERAEWLLENLRQDAEKYSLNWNLMIDDVVERLLKAKL